MSLITSNDLSLNSLLYKTVNYVNDINNYITANFTKEDYAFEIKVKCILGTKIDILKDDISIYSEICKDAEDTTYGYVYYKTINPGIYKVKATLNGKTTYSNAVEFKDEQEESLFVDLNSCSWDMISKISTSGQAKNYFSVGETKQIELNGTLARYRREYTTSLTKNEFNFNKIYLNVFILGFNHDEAKSITFGCFKDNSDTDSGLKFIDIYAEFNHIIDCGCEYAASWPCSDIRYDFLGSCDVKPSSYNQDKLIFENPIPSENCALQPVQNSFMSLLPNSLRSVMRCMNKKASVGAGSDIVNCKDYLPLLSVKEVLGIQGWSTWGEGEQYEYFTLNLKNINFSNTDIFNDPLESSHYWDRRDEVIMTRSERWYNPTAYGDVCGLTYYYTAAQSAHGISSGVAASIFPIFMV